MPEVRIKTDFGEIVIPYSKPEDLETNLEDVQKVIDIVNQKIGKVVEKVSVKTGFEDIYRINSDGSVSILKSSGTTENIGIVLFAYDPKPLKVEQVALWSGVKRATDYLGRSKYFEKLDHGLYKLNAVGLDWVTNKLVPDLRKKKQG